MSNNRDSINPVSRAMIAGALVGTATSCVTQWRHYQQGGQTLNRAAARVVCDASKAGLISGAVMAVANASAHRPLLSLLTVASAGVAGLYLLDAITNKARES